MNITEEQPSFSERIHAEDISENNKEADVLQNGSSLGKFKNANDLYDAYVNLEKEFTKKCQKLKELQIANDNEVKAPLLSDNAKTLPNATLIKNVNNGENVSIKDMLTTPVNKSKNSEICCKEEITDTMSHNKYDSELDAVNVHSTNDSISHNCSVNGASNTASSSSVETKNNSVALPEGIFTNTEIRNKFIASYLNDIQSQKVAPIVVSNSGANFCITPRQKPQSIREAGEIVQEILKN